MPDVKRAVLRWHGGKWMLAPWIISHFPPHKIYVEPFSGAASTLLQKKKCTMEIYNDLDEQVVNLFRVLRNRKTAAQLISAISLTPWSLVEYDRSYRETSDPVESARRLVIRSFMGFGAKGNSLNNRLGWRIQKGFNRGLITAEWNKLPYSLQTVVLRLSEVFIHNRPAIEVMEKFDVPNTLHYLDPPYLPDTRSKDLVKSTSKRGEAIADVYSHEMDRTDHKQLLRFIRTLEGFVVLSGYHSKLYDNALQGWTRFEKEVVADGAVNAKKPIRTEVLWINPAAMKARRSLFRR